MSKSKAKGTAWETAIVNFLEDHGVNARRKVLSGAKDGGDIELPDFKIIVEAKNEQRMSLSEYVDETTEETVNAGALAGVAWHKRRGKGSPGDSYVTMDGYTFLALLILIDPDHAGKPKIP